MRKYRCYVLREKKEIINRCSFYCYECCLCIDTKRKISPTMTVLVLFDLVSPIRYKLEGPLYKEQGSK